MGEALANLLKWLVPPPDHNPLAELAWRWRLATFGCASFLGVLLIYSGLTYHWGLPEFIRPASAGEVHDQIAAVKAQIEQDVITVQKQLSTISDAQDSIQKSQRADRLERIEQQLLWYRQQNCRSKGAARNYTWQKMTDLKDRYREITSTDWQMPACSDIGD